MLLTVIVVLDASFRVRKNDQISRQGVIQQRLLNPLINTVNVVLSFVTFATDVYQTAQ
jgi:hypothetical protein